MSTSAAMTPAGTRIQPSSVPSSELAALMASRRATVTKDQRRSRMTAKNPASAVPHRHSVHTAINAPCPEPTGGAIEMRYLNEPNVADQPSRKVAAVGTTWASVVPLQQMTGPRIHWATTRATSCHQTRSAGSTLIAATPAPIRAAGTAAAAHRPNEP